MREIDTSGRLRAVAYDSVSEIPAQEWNCLASGSFYNSHAWSSYQERDPDCESWVVGVLDDDRLIAASTLHLVAHESNRAYDFEEILGVERGGSSSPLLLCGNRRGYDNRLLKIPGRADGVALLGRSLRAEASRVDSDWAWWPYLDDASVFALSAASAAATPWLLQMSGVFELTGNSFSDFLAARSKSQRERIRKDRRIFAKSGLTISEPAPELHVRQIAELVAGVEERHGKQVEVEHLSQLLHDQLREVGDAASLIACFDGDEMVACSLDFRSSSELAVRVAGVRGSEEGERREYFETVYYRSIELAYDLGLPAVHLGTGALQAKERRGATLRALWALPLTVSTVQAAVDPQDQRRRVLRSLEFEEGVRVDRCSSPFLSTFNK